MSEKNKVHQQIMRIAQSSLDVLVSPTPAEMPIPLRDVFNWVETQLPPGDARQCVTAGLWLLAGDLQKSHVICQEIPTSHGSAWHAVVHRMEGDFWNSKYWWRRAAGISWKGLTEKARATISPMPPELNAVSASNLYDPAKLVDLVEAHHHGTPNLRHALITVQRLEWLTLFDACWIAAAT